MASLRRVAASNIRLENIICISGFGTTGAYGFGIIFVLHLKPSPLGDLGFDIDKNIAMLSSVMKLYFGS